MDEGEFLLIIVCGGVFFLFFLVFIYYPFGANNDACLISLGIMGIVVIVGISLGLFSKSKLKCQNCGKECGMVLCLDCQEKKKIEVEQQMDNDLLDFE